MQCFFVCVYFFMIQHLVSLIRNDIATGVIPDLMWLNVHQLQAKLKAAHPLTYHVTYKGTK